MRKLFLLPLFLVQFVFMRAHNTPMLVHETSSIRVYNLQPEGFVIVSTDDAASEILGFSDQGSFNPEDLPIGLKDLMNSYEDEIRLNGSHVERTKISFAKFATKPDNIVVGQLIKTKWAQTQYYNSKCPEDSQGYGGHVMVGCGAIVMGQTMCYWQYPEHGKGSRTFQSNYGSLYADFENTYYDYENMPAKLTSSSTDEQVDAVATLLYHCGVACGMVYGATSSSVHSSRIVSALTTYFRFKNTVEYVEKSDYSTTGWHNLIQSELNDSAPFFYGASGSYGGHVFICDGYGTTGSDTYYHLNWGWGGQYDGWFKISAFNPGPYDFNNSHAAIIGIRGDHLPKTAVEDVNDDEKVSCKAEKIFVDGHFYIKKGDRVYTITGQIVK